MIGVLHVLDIELPIVGKSLRDAAEHDGLAAAEHAVDPREDLVAEIFLDRRHVLRKRAEHQPVHDRDAQLARIVLLHAEAVGHPAFALDPVFEGDARQVALRVVGPGMIDAGKILLSLAVRVEADQRASVRAAVLENIDFAIVIARDNDGRIAHLRRTE